SNVANLLLVLGVAAVVAGGVKVKYELVAVDLPFLAASGFFLALILWDGTVTFAEGAFCLFGLALYLRYAVSGRPPRGGEAEEPSSGLLKPLAVLVISGALIYGGADFTVLSVVEISTALGIGREVIAASAVALGTSLPEVSVSVAAVRQGRAEMAVGNIVGSNVLNVFGVIGVSALIGPLPVAESMLRLALPVMIVATVLTFFMLLEREMTRWEGWLMLMLYVYFLGALYGLV
ncbi:MAG TPA: sodium:calcium antiporter, partial [Thermoanaerobaculia bacterium]|nr:sodium:calcium antiporter [Thermoanaerobaculia bacterium]